MGYMESVSSSFRNRAFTPAEEEAPEAIEPAPNPEPDAPAVEPEAVVEPDVELPIED